MKPETQDILHEMISIAHKWGWSMTLVMYRKELESEDLWSCFDIKMMKEIFINTSDEEHRMRASDYVIKNALPPDEIVDLLTEYGGTIETDAGMQMLVYITCILPKMVIFDLQRLFLFLFSPTEGKFKVFYTKVADEIARREKPKSPPTG